ncbi:MAG: hypothetical protein IJ973_07230, partial [Christensenellaceae bacterium]|nr:hypothetical protein [Christensenellaceae bacterium]
MDMLGQAADQYVFFAYRQTAFAVRMHFFQKSAQKQAIFIKTAFPMFVQNIAFRKATDILLIFLAFIAGICVLMF